MSNRVLFLTLRTFSATGGIEKVCKVFSKGLNDLQSEGLLEELQVLSMYDKQSDVDPKYLPPKCFTGYGEKKLRFVIRAVQRGCKSQVVILSHINLLLIGFLIKIFSPKTKLLLFAHGIEVWNPVSVLKKHTLNLCDKILTVSAFTKTRMQELFQIPDENITVLNNCLDPFLPEAGLRQKDAALLKKTGFKEDDFVLFTLTRLSSKERYKGYDNVLHAVRDLKPQYPGIKYLIVGKFDEEEVARVKKIIADLSIGEQVFLAGFIPDEELARYFHLADLYVMPSKKEGFGIVFIEAIYYGLPVIAGNKDGSVDALLDGKMGILVDPDSQQQINAAIEKVLLNKAAYAPDHSLLLQHFDFNSYKAKMKSILAPL